MGAEACSGRVRGSAVLLVLATALVMCSADPIFIYRVGVDFILAFCLSQFPNEQVLRREVDSWVPAGGKGITRLKFQNAGMCTLRHSPAPCPSASPAQTLKGSSWNFSTPEVSCHGPVTRGLRPPPRNYGLPWLIWPWFSTSFRDYIRTTSFRTSPAEKPSPRLRGGDQGAQFPGSRYKTILLT